LDGQALPRGPYAVAPEVVAADQRRRMLAAVPHVVAEHGVEGATIDQIVKIAAVRRNSFYEQFEDKRECIAAAYEIAQERLLGKVTYQCYAHSDPAERIRSALTAALELLADKPALARLVVLEAPCAGPELVERHHHWLDRYGRMLRFAAIGAPGVAMPNPAIESAIVGGVVSRIKELLLAGEAERIAELAPELTTFTLSFYALPEAPPSRFVAREPVQPQSSDEDVVLVPAVVS
jgi:AcrR family transcriptional regulator